jgi:hypothetical protein
VDQARAYPDCLVSVAGIGGSVLGKCGDSYHIHDQFDCCARRNRHHQLVRDAGDTMTMIRALLALLLLPLAAQAQTANQVTPGYLSTACPGVGPCFVPTGGPSPVKGFGTLAVTTSSALVSTLTTGPNSAVWPTAPGMVTFINEGATVVYLCPLGGACTTSNGIPMAAGSTLPIFNPSTAATAVDATTGTLVAQW